MEVQNENSTPQSNPKPKDRTALFIGLIVALLGVLVFLYYSNNTLEQEKEAQALELNKTLLQLDSISSQLDSKILTISQLGGEIDTLLKIKQQLETEKKQLLTNQSRQKDLMASLKDRVDGYQELLLAKDVEIEELKKLNDELLTENVELKTEKQQLNESIQEINKAKEELADKVAFASRLKVEGLKVFAVSDGGKEREGEFRSRQVDQLKITFTVADNKVAPIEGKDLLVRIIAPDGNVLFDVTRGSGSFIFEGRELFYSAKQEILYDKNSQLVTVFYKKGSEYVTGSYQVEVYTDDYLMGKGSFLVK
ncbi:MAG: chromosome segregation protein SMC [Marinoscillum sp.]|uniref:chromosome segregation protein SMC n=1 Tax=Marinoscillum sp. TaxID=2024838 RepID=UPI0032FB3293